MTHDLDQSLAFLGTILVVMFLFPFLMSWLEDTLEREQPEVGVLERCRRVVAGVPKAWQRLRRP